MGIGPFPGSFVLPWSEKEDEVQKKLKILKELKELQN